ncbi:MAG: crossover junction endodeoxyribonuclease RuvC [Bacteroidetes bacterium]|nr:crossover junction endodeoxyribonuclease RuvC [Bacteroidota bacterium]
MPEIIREKIILGIDPGTTIMGYGIIRVDGTRIIMLDFGVLKLNKFDDHPLRLKLIFDKTLSLIEQYKPDELAIEAQFFGKNVQSMLKLGRAQGVAIAAALSRTIPIFEYSPRKIKQSITGKGAASKEQVAAMLQRLLLLKEAPESFDATDALAVAVCHHFQKGTVETGKKFTGWKSFLTANPGRVK